MLTSAQEARVVRKAGDWEVKAGREVLERVMVSCITWYLQKRETM
jgi:hypothetical protein